MAFLGRVVGRVRVDWDIPFVALGVLHNYGQSIGPQVLRRTFNTLLLAAQVDQITIRATMGHTSAAMTQRYAEVRMDEKRAAVLNRFG